MLKLLNFSCSRCLFPSDHSDHFLVNINSEIWQESRYFSEVRMNELYDDGRTRGIDGHVDWARLEAEARKMLESGLELADRVEAA